MMLRTYRFASLGIVILILSMLLTSCGLLTYGDYEFLHEQESYEDMTVQIVTVSEGYNSYTEVSTADLDERLTVVLTVEDKETFMEELKALDHNYPFGTPPYGLSSGNAILLTYSDGARELIARQGCALMDGETTLIDYHGWFIKDDYDAFIAKWL